MFKKSTCRVCNYTEFSRIYKAPEMVKGSGRSFDYAFCKHCSSLSIIDIPENLSDYYQNYYSFSKIEINTDRRFNFKKKLLGSLIRPSILSPLAKRIFNSENDFKMKSLLPLRPRMSDKILDVGSGSGDFVYSLYSLGYKNAIGIDPFIEKSIVYPNGVRVLKQGLFEVDDTFDIITLHHTFEHVTDPSKWVREIKTKLKKTGVCIIRIPDICSYSFKLFKQDWVGIHAPYHIFLPSRSALAKILEENGLCVYGSIGEQVMEFFLMSKETSLGVPDQDPTSIRALIRAKKSVKHSPWHSKEEVQMWCSLKKHVVKWDMCDCITYYIRHKE